MSTCAVTNSVQDLVRGARSAKEAEERIKECIPDVSRIIVEKRREQFDIHLRMDGGRSLDICVS